jgi:predicted dehydrogenase
MSKIRIGLIGCGGRQGAHLNSFRQMDNVEVVAVADPVEERRLAAARQTGAKRIYKDHTDLYNHESSETLDVVYIAIEPTAHSDTETRAIEMGIPFLVEKPMTLDLSLAEKIAAMVEKKKLLTAVGFQDRYLDLMEMVKEEIPKHKGGLVYGAWIGGIPGVWWWQKKSTCGGQLLEQNIHLLDGLRWLYGEALSIYATASKGIVRPGIDASAEYDTDDHSTCVIRFENNITATLVSACYSKSIRPNCGLLITMDDIILDYRLRNNLIISTANKTIDINRGNDQTLDLDRAFIHAIETKDGSGIRSPYADSLKTLKLAFEANRSMETGEVIYFK